jgi:hypothetical protein
MILAAAAMLCMPMAALADPAAPTVVSAAAQPGEPLLCHYYYHDGTLVRRPVCKTEREWIRIRLQQQSELADYQLRALRTVER